MNVQKSLLRWGILKLAEPMEPYQPLFGIDTSYASAQRQCSDRMEAIESAIRSCGLGLPGLDVLDVGSSFGYFSLHMASEGSNVDAFDVTRRLEWIVKLLARYNGVHKHVNAHTEILVNENFERLEFLGKLKPRYDVVILLSVLQHICYKNGFEYSRAFLRQIAKRTKYLIVELALHSESNHPWASRQPENVEEFLQGIFRNGFERIGEGFDIGGPHKASRPMYICKNL